jgi:dienelactone hydrolase
MSCARQTLTWFIVLCTALGYWSQAALLADMPFRTVFPIGDTAHPAVLLVPGCSGFVGNNGVNVYDERAAALQDAGFVVVFVDYLGKRMQSNCAHIGQAEVAADILEAARWVASQTDVDASRISVIGWSYGGGAVLGALKTAPPDVPFGKVVLYYPVCRGAAPWSANVSGLMLLGAADDVALPGLCKSVADAMPPDKLHVITYPSARHGFDMRGLPESAGAAPGPGHSREASEASWTAVREFLQ